MAGMFYSLQEAAEKLNMSEEDISKLVEDRKLREFRDGSNVLFKVDEVESLMADTGVLSAEAASEEPQEELSLEPEAAEEEPLELEPMAEEEQPADEPQEAEEEALTLEPEASEEPMEMEPEAAEEEPLELAPAEEEPLTLEPEPVEELGEQGSDVELSLEDSLAMLSEQEAGGQEPSLDDSLALLGDLGTGGQQENAEGDAMSLLEGSGPGTIPPAETEDEDTDLSLSLGDTLSGVDEDLTSADTAITKEGISVLDESDSEFKLSDDTAGETKAMQEASSLEQIEGDVNLDSFGSGSGLLDLSLQADDTSLGGILDEIYTPEGDEGAAVPSPGASAADVAAEAEHMMAQDQLTAAPAAIGYIEPEPDTSSNIFGFMLVIPLLIVVYTLLVTVAGQFGVLSSLIPSGMTVIYALAGLAAISGIVAGYAAMQGAPAKPKKSQKRKTQESEKRKTQEGKTSEKGEEEKRKEKEIIQIISQGIIGPLALPKGLFLYPRSSLTAGKFSA